MVFGRRFCIVSLYSINRLLYQIKKTASIDSCRKRSNKISHSKFDIFWRYSSFLMLNYDNHIPDVGSSFKS